MNATFQQPRAKGDRRSGQAAPTPARTEPTPGGGGQPIAAPNAAAPSKSSHAPPAPASDHGAAAILEDVERGEQLVPLIRLSRQPWAPRGPDGRPKHLMYGFRLRDRGMEAIKTPSGWATTKAAWLRLLAKLNARGASAAPPPPTPDQQQRRRAQVDARLNALGLR